MYEERESDQPDWEIEDEKIPDSLKKKWEKEEKEGIRAGVCASCGCPFTQEDLSCRHCGASTDIPGASPKTLRKWFANTRTGFLVSLVIVISIILFLAR